MQGKRHGAIWEMVATLLSVHSSIPSLVAYIDSSQAGEEDVFERRANMYKRGFARQSRKAVAAPASTCICTCRQSINFDFVARLRFCYSISTLTSLVSAQPHYISIRSCCCCSSSFLILQNPPRLRKSTTTFRKPLRLDIDIDIVQDGRRSQDRQAALPQPLVGFHRAMEARQTLRRHRLQWRQLGRHLHWKV